VSASDAEIYRKHSEELIRFATGLVGPSDAPDGKRAGAHAHIELPNAKDFRFQHGTFFPAQPGEPGWAFRLTFSDHSTGFLVEEDVDQAPSLGVACPSNTTLMSIPSTGQTAGLIPPPDGPGDAVAPFYNDGTLYQVYGPGTTHFGAVANDRIVRLP
jgi:hypothetical protein